MNGKKELAGNSWMRKLSLAEQWALEWRRGGTNRAYFLCDKQGEAGWVGQVGHKMRLQVNAEGEQVGCWSQKSLVSVLEVLTEYKN